MQYIQSYYNTNKNSAVTVLQIIKIYPQLFYQYNEVKNESYF
jgi:hypothetical protein